MATFKFIMFFVWAAAMLLACWAWEVARMFDRRMKKEAERRNAAASQLPGESATEWPAAAVILPVKGLDDDTEENLRALLAQDYPRYRLFFAVESAEDPVLPLLARLAQEAAVPPIHIIIAGVATARGQKIHNQLAALAQTSPDDQVLVFMDADAHPRPNWIRAMVLPLLKESNIGATTGFRYYIPETSALPNAMPAVINAGVAALLGPGWRNIAWGGSMAIIRANFFAFGIDAAWQNALSDDYVLSWCVKNKSRRIIQFVPACLVASAANFTWAAFWEFAARQYRITKICAPAVWLTAIGAAALYLVALAYTFLFFLLSLPGILPDPQHPRGDYLLALMFAALYIANFLRGRYLLTGALAAFPDQSQKLHATRFWFTWAYPFSLLINLLALFRSAPGKVVTWRGIRYKMLNRLQTILLPSP